MPKIIVIGHSTIVKVIAENVVTFFWDTVYNCISSLIIC